MDGYFIRAGTVRDFLSSNDSRDEFQWSCKVCREKLEAARSVLAGGLFPSLSSKTAINLCVLAFTPHTDLKQVPPPCGLVIDFRAALLEM